MEKTIVVKIGGSTLGSHDTTMEDLVALQKQGLPVVVVHGGGATITQWLEKQGIAAQFVRGLRVTDGPTLEVVVAVLAGLINKQLVADLSARGGRAVGLSGADGGIIKARVKQPELGFVGDVVSVNLEAVRVVLEGNFMPVIAPTGLLRSTTGNTAQLLNLNADHVAGEIASALGAERLIFLTDVPGIKDKDGAVLAKLSPAQAGELMAAQVISGGMIPKVEASLKALESGTETVIVDGRVPHALLSAIERGEAGTRVAR